MVENSYLTRLQAVNLMLAGSQRPQVSALDTGNDPDDVTSAIFLLDQMTRQVQNEGWHFNTQEDVTIALNASNQIELPTNAMRIKYWEHSDTVIPVGDSYPPNLTIRGQTDSADPPLVYDLANNTTVFTSTVPLVIVYQLEWNELPPAVRHYIAMAAAVDLQEMILGDKGKDRLLRAKAAEARAALIQEETEVGRFGSAQSFPVHRVIHRRFLNDV